MKKLIILCILLLPMVCQAHELKILLTCNATPEYVKYYRIFVNGKQLSKALAQADNSLKEMIRLRKPGKYEFSAKACIRDGCSELSETDVIEYSTYIREINKNNFKVIRYIHKYIER